MKHAQPTLVLPQDHALSLKLAAHVTSEGASAAPVPGVVNVKVISPGLVEMLLRGGDPAGYGGRTWPLRVGGAGVGDDAQNAALARLGGLVVRAPVAVRFAVPIALLGVDDAGFVDTASFWSEALRREPTLHNIAAQLVRWLEGAHEEGKTAEWRGTEGHAKKSLGVIAEYAAIRKSEICSIGSNRIPLVLLQRVAPEWVVPALRSCFVTSKRTSKAEGLDWKGLVTEIGPGIYTFDLFTPEFCDLLVAEVDAFEVTKLPCRRPNTMNKLGLVTNDIGLEPMLTDILERLVAPMCQALYHEDAPMITSALDHHHSFVVRYRTEGATQHRPAATAAGADGSRGLDMHHDASEATLNVCLGRARRPGGGLRFCGRRGDVDHRRAGAALAHVRGRAVLHLGRHRHGADEIVAGERLNLIVWARNSAYRGAAAFGHVALDGTPQRKETGDVDRLCLSKSNDRDYEERVKSLDGVHTATRPVGNASQRKGVRKKRPIF